MYPEVAKTSLIDPSLACSIAKLYGFAGLEVVPKVFSRGIRPENAVWMRSGLDALFRRILDDSTSLHGVPRSFLNGI